MIKLLAKIKAYVIPAQTGIQKKQRGVFHRKFWFLAKLDSRLRGNDGDWRAYWASLSKLAAIAVLMPLALTACFSEEKTGPVDVHLDRDSCEMCRMLISDPRFVTEIRGGPDMKPYMFDDMGDALHWLNKQTWKNEVGIEIWVADMTSEKKITWLDATKAFYVAGQMTPMNYGFGAIAEQSDKAVPFQIMKDTILGKGNNLLCETPLTVDETEEPKEMHGTEGHTQADHQKHMQDPDHKHDPAHNHPEEHK